MKTENLAIAFVDIVGFTPRTSSQSREENERMLRRFDEVVRPLASALGGRVVKSIGDAFLLTFRSPTDALHCAMAMHDRLAESNARAAASDRFEIRVAVNAGEVRVENGDVFGEAVNIASRIEGEAGAGEVWFSEAVYLVMTRSEVPYEEVGMRTLKGLPEPVKLYRIPRVSEVGRYRVQGDGRPPETTSHPLTAPALPYGGASLERARERLAADPLRRVKDAVSRGVAAATPRAKRAVVTAKTRFRDSRAFRVGAVAAVLVFVLALVASLAWPERKRPETRWEKFKRELREAGTRRR